jgi:hypothetical protein
MIHEKVQGGARIKTGSAALEQSSAPCAKLEGTIKGGPSLPVAMAVITCESPELYSLLDERQTIESARAPNRPNAESALHLCLAFLRAYQKVISKVASLLQEAVASPPKSHFVNLCLPQSTPEQSQRIPSIASGTFGGGINDFKALKTCHEIKIAIFDWTERSP